MLNLTRVTQDVTGAVVAVQEWLEQSTTDSAAPWTTAALLNVLRKVRAHQPEPLLGYYSTPAMQEWGEIEYVAAGPGLLPQVRC